MPRKHSLVAVALAAGLAALGCSADAAEGPAVGKPAPAFTAVDTQGKEHSLAGYQGKWVVLEWLNHGCPFVQKHYDGKAMQALQKKWTDQGIVWLSIVSSAPGKQGHYPTAEHDSMAAAKGASPTAILVDETGKVGRLYDARNTPQMFVIDPQGTLVYMGGIDDRPTTDVADLQGAKPYVDQALTEAMAGKPVTTAVTQPYGCSVKY